MLGVDNELTYRLFFIGLAVDVFLPLLRVDKYTRIVLGTLSALLLAVAIFWSHLYPYIPSQLASSLSDLVMNAWAWFVLILFAPFCLVALPLLMNKKQQVANVQQSPPRQNKLIIHSAMYGLDARNEIDITDHVRKLVKNGELHVRVYPDDLGCDDPYLDQPKRLRVRYSYGDAEERTTTRRDLQMLHLPEN